MKKYLFLNGSDGSKKDGVKWSNSLIQEHMNMFLKKR